MVSSIMLLSSCSINSGVKHSQLQVDIEKSEFLQNSFSSDFVCDSQYQFISHNIIKRQTNINEKEDIIFCEVLAENNYFKVILEAELKYIYYDQGGWVLENINVYKKKATAIAPPELELVRQYLIEKIFIKSGSENVFNCWDSVRQVEARNMDYTIGNLEFDVESQSSKIKISLVSPVIEINGNYSLLCSEDTGWYFEKKKYNNGVEDKNDVLINIDSCEFNYDRALGTFSYRGVISNDIVKFESIDTINSKITYRRNDETPITKKFDVITGSFEEFTEVMTGMTDLRYNPYDDCWYYRWGSIKEYKRVK